MHKHAARYIACLVWLYFKFVNKTMNTVKPPYSLMHVFHAHISQLLENKHIICLFHVIHLNTMRPNSHCKLLVFYWIQVHSRSQTVFENPNCNRFKRFAVCENISISRWRQSRLIHRRSKSNFYAPIRQSTSICRDVTKWQMDWSYITKIVFQRNNNILRLFVL